MTFLPLHTKRQALVALVFLSLIWGYNWVVMKEALHDAPPFAFAALRTLPGALLLFAAMAIKRQPLAPPAPLGMVALGLFQTMGFTALSCAALVKGGAGKSAVLAFTMPFWTLLLAWPLLGEKVQGSLWLVVSLALSGMLLVLEPWNLHTPLTAKLLALAAGATWAIGAIIAKRLRQQHAINVLSMTAWQMLFGGIGLAMLAFVANEPSIIWSNRFIIRLCYNIVLVTAIGWLIWLYILAQLPAGTAGLSILAIPLIGLVASRLQLGEGATPTELTGMALIAASLGALAWRNRKT
jgi:drug/metabolite transporter (DMT)-like permease